MTDADGVRLRPAASDDAQFGAAEVATVRCRIGGATGIVVPALYPGTPRPATPALSSGASRPVVGAQDGTNVDGAFASRVEGRTSIPLAGIPLGGTGTYPGWSDPELHVDCLVPSSLIDAIVPRSVRPRQGLASDP